MDIGIYCIEAMLSLFGEPKKFDAYGYIIPSSIDGYGLILATYEDMICSIDYSKITNSDTPCVFEGEEGTLYIDRIATPSKV
jgi:predicted dehydrogenase